MKSGITFTNIKGGGYPTCGCWSRSVSQGYNTKMRYHYVGVRLMANKRINIMVKGLSFNTHSKLLYKRSFTESFNHNYSTFSYGLRLCKRRLQ